MSDTSKYKTFRPRQQPQIQEAPMSQEPSYLGQVARIIPESAKAIARGPVNNLNMIPNMDVFSGGEGIIPLTYESAQIRENVNQKAPGVGEVVQEGLNQAGINIAPAQDQTLPERIMSKVLETGSSMAAVPGGGGAAQAAKLGAKIGAASQGAQELGADPLVADIGASVAVPIAGALKKPLRNLAKEAENKEALKKDLSDIGADPERKKSLGEKVAGKLLSLGSKPDVEALKIAKEMGLELPYNVKLDSRIGNFLANNLLKTVFTSKSYRDQLEKFPQAVIEKFKNGVNKIHPEEIDPVEASRRYLETLSPEQVRVKEGVQKLYSESNAAFKATDKILPTNTMKWVEELERDIKLSPYKATPNKQILSIIDDVKKQWLTEIPKTTKKQLEHWEKILPPEKYAQIEAQMLKKVKEVPVQSVIALRKNLLREIDYGANIKGGKGSVKKLIEGSDSDVMSSSNKIATQKWREAGQFKRVEEAERTMSDIARSLSEGVIPKDAFSYMNNTKNIKELERLLGPSKNAKEVMSGLKRAKFQQEVADKVMNSNGNISYANLANTFLGKSGKQNLLKTLSGDSYKEMKNLAKISQRLVRAGQEFGNPSGTAHASKDMDKIGAIMAGILGLASGSTAAITAATGAAVTTTALSKMVSNPKILNAANEYALARLYKKADKAARAKKAMSDIFNKEIAADQAKGVAVSSAKPRKKEEY